MEQSEADTISLRYKAHLVPNNLFLNTTPSSTYSGELVLEVRRVVLKYGSMFKKSSPHCLLPECSKILVHHTNAQFLSLLLDSKSWERSF